MLASGLPEMRVEVDESRKDVEAAGVEDIDPVRREILSDRLDAAAGEAEIEPAVAPRRRVHDAPSPDEQRGAHASRSGSQGCPPRRR
jgi:hypothetical protein